MDPLAHSLFGAALARTRMAREVPYATATLVLAANAPDIDVLAYFAGPDAALGFRRGWTHGPIALALLPPLVIGALALFARWRGQPTVPLAGRLLALAYLGALSHPLLDWLNTYGVRLLMPFDDRWFYGDTLFIVDPWMWLLLGAAAYLGRPLGPRARRGFLLLAAATSTVVVLTSGAVVGRVLFVAGVVAVAASANASARSLRRGERIATALLVSFLLYVAAMYLGARGASSRARAELEARGIGPIEDLMAGPLPLDPLVRDVVAVTEGRFHFARFHWLNRERLVLAPESEARLPSDSRIQSAWHDSSIRGFAGWARFPFVELPAAASDRVYFLDARYARRWPARFGAVAVELGHGNDAAAPR